MRVRRAVGAATLALTAAITLSGCTDNPSDKAFGGLGDAPVQPSMPNPSFSLRPSGMPDFPGASSGGSSSSGGLSSGGSGGSTSGGTTGGLSSGGLSSGGSGGSGPTSRPQYNAPANSEVIGENCSYQRSTGRITYEVDIQNASTEFAYQYNFTVQFKVGKYPNSTVASKSISSQFKTVTVAPGGDRSISLHASYPTNERLVYSCQVISARKSPAS
ncbi:hypothetical protein [Streptomyces sp. PTY087I2]|uniref:hypothetical protein n=1 Tax=Streptomyces sp. PTY087I2 TaxID=1819298 RepID=UPI00080B0E3C|nr:hypothetical protein [Streptomyces sp. PTY087I2]OCC13395.1 hypothetical protein A3Q37_00951 [Streptomyces sp. PTY087I2]